MRSPWNDGSIALRSAMCAGPSSSSTLLAPSSGLRIALPSPAWSTFGSPVNTRLTSSGCDTITHGSAAVDVHA